MSHVSRRNFLAGLLATPVVAACGGGDDAATASTEPETTTTSPATTTTTTVALPVQPLTGLAHAGDPAILARPALVVKINNIDTGETARPQAGLNQADVVFEERVEGGISRFAAVFHSTDADPVLPVRSARYTDIEICSMLNRPLFANSGGNQGVMGAVRDSNLVPVGHADVGNDFYYRVSDRRAPHNLATSTPALYGLTPAGALPPSPLFTYRTPGTPPAGGLPNRWVHVEFGGGSGQSPVDHIYDPALGGWARFQNGTPHVDAAGVQVAPQNVIVQFIDYDGTTGILLGEGDAWVCTGEGVVIARWHRPDPVVPTAFLDAAGAPIPVLPGRTWILLPPPGGGSLV